MDAMKAEQEALLVPETGAAKGRGTVLVALAIALGLILALYFQTFVSMTQIWYRSETFAHGYLIVPMAAYLIWLKRAELKQLDVSPQWLGLPFIVGLGFGWMLAYLAGVQVVQQLAATAMIPVACFTLLGWQVTRTLFFPLAFLMLAVPMGEELIPMLMNFTADFVVVALKASGIPVFREGTFFTIPSGNWSVVEECSGLRYLIASITVGSVYAYLTYRSLFRRAAFIAVSVIVPVFANGLRAYMIVMIAHFSNMTLAVGVDHLIYGWVFFGLVMLLMFWIGAFWREDHKQAPAAAGTTRVAHTRFSRAVMIGVLAAIAVWPAWALYLDASKPDAQTARITSPAPANGWSLTRDLSDWRPRYVGADAELYGTYAKNGETVAVYIAYYSRQRQDAELINSQNVLVEQKHPTWAQISDSGAQATIGEREVRVHEGLLRSSLQRLLVWEWFVIGDHHFSQPYLGKLLLARNRLINRPDSGAAIVLSTPQGDSAEHSSRVLQDFVGEMLPSIEQSIASVGGDR